MKQIKWKTGLKVYSNWSARGEEIFRRRPWRRTEHLGSPKVPKKRRNCRKLPFQSQPVTRGVTEWSMKFFSEWQGKRLTKKASDKQGNSVDGSQSKIRGLDIDVCNMSAEIPKFVMEVCKEDGESFPPQTLSTICCAMECHFSECNGVMRLRIRTRRMTGIKIVTDMQ